MAAAKSLSRRNAMATGTVGLAGLAALAGTARATSNTSAWTAQEKAQVELVNIFYKARGDNATTVYHVMSFMTEDCSFKINGQPTTTGAREVAALFETFFKGGTRYEMVIHENFAKGPMVVHSRTDTTLRLDKREEPGPIVGVYVFKDSKIQEREEVIHKG